MPPDQTGREPTPPDDAGPPLGFLVAAAGNASMGAFAALLAPHEIHPRQFAVLWALTVADGRSQRALSAELHIPASRVVGLVDDLEARGLLERRSHPTDRRTHPLHLTAAGRRCFGQLRQLAAAQEDRMLDGLDPADRERLRLLLVRVSANLGMTPGEPGGIRAW